MTYKTYLPKDYPLQNLLDFVIEVDSLFMPPLSERVKIKEYTKKLYTNATISMASASNGEVAGLAAYYNNDTVTKEAYITLFCVKPSFHGKGLARNLLKVCIDNCRANKMNRIRTETWETNSAALKLYLSEGFEVTAKKFDRVGHRSIKLEKHLQRS